MKIPLKPKNKHEQQILAYFEGYRAEVNCEDSEPTHYKRGSARWHHFIKGWWHSKRGCFEDHQDGNKVYHNVCLKCAWIYGPKNEFRITTEERRSE
jgi:hypothetical protein